MKKLIAMSAAFFLLSASASWGITFKNMNASGTTPVDIFFNGASVGAPDANGGAAGNPPDLSRFGGGADNAIQTSTGWNGSNDFFGIFHITNINNTDNSMAIWDALSEFQQGVSIVGMFFGFDETHFRRNGTLLTDGVDVWSSGGRMEFYAVPDGTFPTIIGNGPTAGTLSLSTNTAASSPTFPGITDVGTELFALDLAAGALPNTFPPVFIPDPSTSDARTILGGADEGNFYGHIDPTFGTIADRFNNEGFAVDGNGLETDFEGLYAMEALTNPSNLKAASGWQLAFDSGPNHSANVSQVPEPSTLMLLGTGLLGMVGYARRRKAA